MQVYEYSKVNDNRGFLFLHVGPVFGMNSFIYVNLILYIFRPWCIIMHSCILNVYKKYNLFLTLVLLPMTFVLNN